MPKRKRKVQRTDKKAIAIWRVVTQNKETYVAAGKMFGISSKCASNWARYVRDNEELLERAKSDEPINFKDTKNSQFTKMCTHGRLISAWRMSEKDNLSVQDIAKKFGVSGSTIRAWLLAIPRYQELLDLAKSTTTVAKDYMIPNLTVAIYKPKNSNSNGNGIPKNETSMEYPVKYIEQLRDELAFMKWWNKGERLGYVERLLKALEQG